MGPMVVEDKKHCLLCDMEYTGRDVWLGREQLGFLGLLLAVQVLGLLLPCSVWDFQRTDGNIDLGT